LRRFGHAYIPGFVSFVRINAFGMMAQATPVATSILNKPSKQHRLDRERMFNVAR